MRRYFVFFALCLIFFIVPLQIFIIGDFDGIGIQGATYRYQTSIYGTSFFPITREIVFVINGTYWGKTALSILLWVMGTLILTCTTLFAFLHVHEKTNNYFKQISYGLIVSCGIYLGSCVAQYGFLLHGPVGISLPIGIIGILCWIAALYYWNTFSKNFGSVEMLRSQK